MMPSLQVGGDRMRRAHDAEGERLDQDPADQVLVVAAAGHGDHAAEDVREQQHEHQRLQRDVEQLLGDLADVLEVARARATRLSDGPKRRRATWLSSGGHLLGRRRRLGQGQEHVVQRRLAAVDVDGVDAGRVERPDDVDEARARADAGR